MDRISAAHYSLLQALDVSQKIPEHLFHYTTFDGLHGILRSSKLWATDTRFLNDKTERRYAEEVLTKFLKDMADGDTTIYPPTLEHCIRSQFGPASYVTCFCEEGDLLSMWRAYASVGGGYSIGFAGAELHDLLSPIRDEFANVRDISAGLFGKVQYGSNFPAAMKTYISEVVDHFRRKPLLEPLEEISLICTIAEISVLVKHPAFKEEQEWRHVVPSQSLDRLCFRSAGGFPKPYIEVPLDLDEPAGQLLPIRKIVVGPTVAAPEIEDTLQQMLAKYGYSSRVQVVPSQVPFRS